MVGEAAAGLAIKPDQKAFINYWYRHIWEYVSPLYPGIILLAGLTHLPFQRLALANAPFALSVVFWGALFCFAGIGRARFPHGEKVGKGKALSTFFIAVAPILLTLILVVLLRVNPVVAMGGVTIALYALHRYSWAELGESLRESVSLKALFLVIGIMVFQETLKVTGALGGSFAIGGRRAQTSNLLLDSLDRAFRSKRPSPTGAGSPAPPVHVIV